MLFTILLLTPPTFAADPRRIAGTWNVVATWDGVNTCPDDGSAGRAQPAGGKTSYQWLVSATAEGTVKIAVLGETGFPSFDGRWTTDDTLVLTGYDDAYIEKATAAWTANATTLRLFFDDALGTMRGTRIVAVTLQKAGLLDRGTVTVPCISTATVEAKR